MAVNLFSLERFRKLPVVGIIRNLTPEQVADVLPLYKETGFTTIEITMNTPGATRIIRSAIDQYAGSLNIGAGTVCNLTDLNLALEAGAQFIVTPVVNEPLIRACVQRNIPVFPGALTPTEIFNAWDYGAKMVKVFPASSIKPDYIKELKGPLNQIKLLPTGGVTIDNCTDFLAAGADGLGIGSQLFNKSKISTKNWKGLEVHFKGFANKIQDYTTK